MGYTIDMPTSHRRLKSPRSLSGTSTHPTMVKKSISRSRMDDSHPFRSMSIGRPIPEIKLFQTLALNRQGQGHGCGQRERSYRRQSILPIRFLFVSYLSDPQFLRYSYFEIWLWKIQRGVWPWKCTPKIFKINSPKKVSNKISPKSIQVICRTSGR